MRKRRASEKRPLSVSGGGVIDGTAPELRKLLGEREQLDNRIAKLRETERLKRDAKFAKRRSAQEGPKYVGATGMQGGLPA